MQQEGRPAMEGVKFETVVHYDHIKHHMVVQASRIGSISS